MTRFALILFATTTITMPALAEECATAADPLGALIGQVPAPEECDPTLPDWYEDSFDIDATIAGAETILAQQGSAIGGTVNDIVFSDADHTIIKSTTPTLLRHKETRELFRTPDGMPVILVGRNNTQFTLLKQKYPNIDWTKWRVEHSEFGSVAEILRQEAIAETISALQSADEREDSRQYVVTARFQNNVDYGLDAYLTKRGIDIDGVFVINHTTVRKTLELNGHGFDSPMRKAATMAALMKANGFGADADKIHINIANAGQLQDLPGVGEAIAQRIIDYRDAHGDFASIEDLANVSGIGPAKVAQIKPKATATVRTVTYYEDKDANLIAAMQLLPVLYPNVRFKFVDPVHVGNHVFEHEVAAQTSGAGLLEDADGEQLCDTGIAQYSSDDQPDAVLQGLA